MTNLLLFVLAAVTEIAGCFAFWAWWRLGKSILWLLPGLVCLVVFALALALVNTPAAGRTFAAYGGIYITASLGWLWAVENIRPDRFDLAGGAICLIGAAVIIGAPR